MSRLDMLSIGARSLVEQSRAKAKSGFRLFPAEEALIELAELALEEPCICVTGDGSDEVEVDVSDGVINVILPEYTPDMPTEAVPESRRVKRKVD